MTKNDNFNSSRNNIISMPEGEEFNPALFIQKEVWKYAKEHTDEMLAIADRGDYEEIPPLDDFDKWYFDELEPRASKVMKEHGYSEDKINEVVGENWIRFYRVTLPSMETRRHMADDKKENGITA